MIPMEPHGAPDDSNLCVVIRVRPPLPRELEEDGPFVNVVYVHPSEHSNDIPRTLTIAERVDAEEGCGGVFSSSVFTFDAVFDQHVQQDTVYRVCAHPAVESVLQGYNASLIAYGQTGTGKTYTMEGFATSPQHCGIIPRATEAVFQHIVNSRTQRRSPADPTPRFLVRASYLQIYNENVCDLICPERRNLSVREDRHGGVYVDGLSEYAVRSPEEVYGLMERGALTRATGTTRMSEMSSRSHAIFVLVVEVSEGVADEDGRGGRQTARTRVGKLNIVDLAGSEKVRQTGATGRRLEESKRINRSLSALGNVIAKLTAKTPHSHVPYRDSRLTRILEDSLGGNCKTTMIACISPSADSYSESLSTLKFANRAKHVTNIASVNEDVDNATLVRMYKKEVKALRAQLSALSKGGSVPPALSGVASGGSFEDGSMTRRTPTGADLSTRGFGDREGGEAAHETTLSRGADKGGGDDGHAESAVAKAVRYKQLLFKQRDIMIALTARLNEKDDALLAAQEEIDALRANVAFLEEAVDERVVRVVQLEAQVKSLEGGGAAATPAGASGSGSGKSTKPVKADALGGAADAYRS